MRLIGRARGICSVGPSGDPSRLPSPPQSPPAQSLPLPSDGQPLLHFGHRPLPPRLVIAPIKSSSKAPRNPHLFRPALPHHIPGYFPPIPEHLRPEIFFCHFFREGPDSTPPRFGTLGNFDYCRASFNLFEPAFRAAYTSCPHWGNCSGDSPPHRQNPFTHPQAYPPSGIRTRSSPTLPPHQ